MVHSQGVGCLRCSKDSLPSIALENRFLALHPEKELSGLLCLAAMLLERFGLHGSGKGKGTPANMQ